MTTLLDITTDRQLIEAIIQDMEGEITPEIEQALLINQNQLSEKGESYILIIEKIRSQIELNKRYKEKAEDNIKKLSKAINRLEINLQLAAETFGEFEAGIHKVGLKKNPPAVIVEDEEKIPSEYKTTKITTVVVKDKIKKAIQDGKDVPGASLIQKESLKIK